MIGVQTLFRFQDQGLKAKAAQLALLDKLSWWLQMRTEHLFLYSIEHLLITQIDT
jgi:hypothetical protein